MDNKTCHSPVESDSHRSTGRCRTRTCRHVVVFEMPASLTSASFLTDAHAHIIENGLMMELPLAGSKSVQGEFQLFIRLFN